MSATGKHFLQRHLSSHLEAWNHLKPFHAFPCCFHPELTVTAFVKDTKSSRFNIGKRKVTSHNSDLSCSFNTVDFDMYVFISLFLSLYIFMCNPDPILTFPGDHSELRFILTVGVPKYVS